MFTDPRSGDGGAVWIDTVGYDDTGNKDDEEIFRNILKFIQSHDLTKVTDRERIISSYFLIIFFKLLR